MGISAQSVIGNVLFEKKKIKLLNKCFEENITEIMQHVLKNAILCQAD
jgi:hypothetical protein